MISNDCCDRANLLKNVRPPKYWFGDTIIYYWIAEDPDDPSMEFPVFFTATIVGLAWGKMGSRLLEREATWHYCLRCRDEAEEDLSDCLYREEDLDLFGQLIQSA